MAQKKRSSILDLSITAKIFIAFIIIGLLFGVQSVFSTFSINQLEDDYSESQDLNTVNENARLIVSQHRSEAQFYTKRYLGLESHVALDRDFQETRIEVDGLYNDTNTKLLRLSSITDLEGGSYILQTIRTITEEYYGNAEILFNQPTLTLIDGLYIEAGSILTKINEGFRNLNAWIHTRNETYEIACKNTCEWYN
ncbi:MAG: hypothetical protein ACXAD7_27450 [Candidatus Kariarchaeaceae archaeon]